MPHLSPIDQYQHDLKNGGFMRDSAQEIAINHLQALYEKLVEAESSKKQGRLANIAAKVQR